MNKKKGLQEFVEEMEMTVLSREDQILLDGMVGTSGVSNQNCPCQNTVPGCGCAVK